MKQPLKSLTELGPLAVFFVFFKMQGILYATAALIAATIVAIAVTYYMVRKIPMMPLISAVVIGIFGGLTIFSGNDMFIKIKPTMVNLVFAGILFVGAMKGKGLLKHLFDGAMHMGDAAWLSFSVRWGMLFVFLAILNEIVWRNFSDDVWVTFKVFGILGITFVFMATQFPFIKANVIDKKEE